MEKIIELLPQILWISTIVIAWVVIRKILNSLSGKINNSELYKEEMLNVLEEIREELKELNKKNSDK
jgi:hypothetical protein